MLDVDVLDVDALLDSVDGERDQAAATIQAHRRRKSVMDSQERRSKMATPIQAHARGMLARQHAARQESSLVHKVRRASAGLMDFTQSLYLDITELTGSAPPAASPSASPTPQQLRTLPLESPPTAPATPLARAARPRPRDDASCCSCLSRNGGVGGPLFRLPWASPVFGTGSSTFDTPMLDRLLTAHRFRWTAGPDSDTDYLHKSFDNVLSPGFFARSPYGSQASAASLHASLASLQASHRSMSSSRSQRSIL